MLADSSGRVESVECRDDADQQDLPGHNRHFPIESYGILCANGMAWDNLWSKMGLDTTAHLDDLLKRFCAGDSDARLLIIERSLERLRTLSRRQLHKFPKVERWNDEEQPCWCWDSHSG